MILRQLNLSSITLQWVCARVWIIMIWLLTPLLVLDPHFMDQMFRNLANDEFFESEWITECNDSLVEAIKKYMASKIPDSISSSLSMRSKTDNIAFLIDEDILGASTTNPHSTTQESGKEELLHYLRLAWCNNNQDPLDWWKHNGHLYPRISAVARDVPDSYPVTLKIFWCLTENLGGLQIFKTTGTSYHMWWHLASNHFTTVMHDLPICYTWAPMAILVSIYLPNLCTSKLYFLVLICCAQADSYPIINAPAACDFFFVTLM